MTKKDAAKKAAVNEAATKKAKAKKQAKQQKQLAPALGPIGMMRWAWTQLTTMRTAMVLLMLLAVAAVPGSLFPQRNQDPQSVAQYIAEHEVAGPILDKLQLFDVFTSVWFSAIYLLLFVSLIGCVIPRARQHARATVRPPARTPVRLNRMPVNGVIELEANQGDSEEIAQTLRSILRKRRYRTSIEENKGQVSVAAERGYLREWGNLTFHVSLIGVLIAVAVGGLFGYNGQRIIVQGEGFTNTLIAYDQFSPGQRFKAENLQPFQLKLKDFKIQFDRQERADGKYGQPIDYEANLDVRHSPDAEWVTEKLKVNEPLRVAGTDIYLLGNGYAPMITVTDGEGNVAFSGPVVAQPQDPSYMSLVVLKVPDAKPTQLGFQGFFLPTTVMGENGVAYSGDPEALAPSLNLDSYYGDLGLETGAPQNVYVLKTEKMTQLNSRKLEAGGIVLGLNPQNREYKLPEGKGTIRFDGLKRFIGIEVHHDPGKPWLLGFSMLAVAGLLASLFIPRRRVWFKVSDPDEAGKRRIEYALLARGEDPRLQTEAEALVKAVSGRYTLAE